MLGRFGVFSALFKVLATGAVFACVSFNCPGVAADSTAEVSITVTATVAPVRDIIISPNGLVKEIVTNTTRGIVPNVYVGSLRSSEVALSPAILNQYKKIISKSDPKKTGIIYLATSNHSVNNSRPFSVIVSMLPQLFR